MSAEERIRTLAAELSAEAHEANVSSWQTVIEALEEQIRSLRFILEHSDLCLSQAISQCTQLQEEVKAAQAEQVKWMDRACDYARRAKELEESRKCPVCDWTFAKSANEGCVPGNCSYRPYEGSAEWWRIKKRRDELAAQEGHL